MKKNIFLLLLCLAFTTCKKEPILLIIDPVYVFFKESGLSAICFSDAKNKPNFLT